MKNSIIIYFVYCSAFVSAQVAESEITANGIILPRLDHTQILIPTEGQIIYDYISESIWLYQQADWKEINCSFDGGPKNVLDCGAIADRVTDNTAVINACIHELNQEHTVNGVNLGWEIVIPKNVKFDFDLLVNLPQDYIINDGSTFDWQRPSPSNDTYWTAQIKKIIHTSNPGMKNANEFMIISDYHPALTISNTYNYADPASEDFQASVVFGSGGDRKWRIGMGSNDKPDFLIAGRDPAPTNRLTARMHILDDFGNFGFNSRGVQGIDYTFSSTNNSDPLNFKFLGNESNQPTSFLFHHGSNASVSSSRMRFDQSGEISILQSGNYGTTFGANQSIFGYRNEVENHANTTVLTKNENHKILTNETAAGNIDFILPTAEKGNVIKVVVVENQAITIKPSANDAFRSLTSQMAKTSNTLGSSIELYCVVAGIWEVNVLWGEWDNISF